MTLTERIVECIDLDLAFLGDEVEHEEDGGQVVFTTKELLVDIRKSINDLGQANKQDLLALEQRIAEKINHNGERISTLEQKVQGFEVWRARTIGMAIGLGAGAGGLSGLLINAIVKATEGGG